MYVGEICYDVLINLKFILTTLWKFLSRIYCIKKHIYYQRYVLSSFKVYFQFIMMFVYLLKCLIDVAHNIIKVLQCSMFVICSNEKVEGCCEGNSASETRKEAGVCQNEATNPHYRLANSGHNISSYLYLRILQNSTHINAIRVKFK